MLHLNLYLINELQIMRQKIFFFVICVNRARAVFFENETPCAYLKRRTQARIPAGSMVVITISQGKYSMVHYEIKQYTIERMVIQ